VNSSVSCSRKNAAARSVRRPSLVRCSCALALALLTTDGLGSSPPFGSACTRGFGFGPGCSLKSQCTTGPERRITRWEHEHLLEAVQQRLDANPQAMRQRRETVEHPFGTIKARMGATHFLTKTLPKVAAEMALAVLAYNLTRVMNIVGTKPLIVVLAG